MFNLVLSGWKMKKLLIALASVFVFSSVAAAVQEQMPASGQLVKHADQIKTVDGGNKVFTGKVSITPLHQAIEGMPVGGAFVTFEPGARSFWHTHPVGQVLIIVEGEGRSGVYGEKVSVLKKGDVVVCPKGVKHFHGAAPNQRMVQMTITGQDPSGSNVTWMEPVTDEQYLNIENRN